MVHKFSGIVKRQIDYWKYQVAHYGPDHPRYRPAKLAKYEHLIREFGELADFLDTLPDQDPVDNATTAQPVERSFPVSAFQRRRRVAEAIAATPAEPEAPNDIPDDLADLPLELLQELSESARGETDPLIKIINGRGGTATLDEILIDLWRKYKEIGKRPIISNKLYRLSRRGLCWPLPGKKGIYTTTKPSSGNDTPSAEDDEGPDAAAPPTSAKPETSAKSASSVSSKARRDLFASTAIPSNRVPH